LKDNQTYTSFSQAHLCAAFSDDLENPELKFHNAAAILKFTSTSTIHKVVFYGNKSETITGGNDGLLKISYADGAVTTTAASTGGTSITVQTDGAESDFYMAVIPVVFSRGITVDCYDSDLKLIATKTTMNEISTVSSAGTPRVINLGSVQDWMANSQPEAVDLGLSVKWATCNVGATKPEEYGEYFAWGETEPKGDYSWSTYKWCNGSSSSLTKYNTDSSCGTVDNKTVLASEDDAAHVNWGGDWRMPTDAEWTELRTNCTWTWTTQNGVNGRLVTGPNGNSIFLPAAGVRIGTYLSDAGSCGLYWSSSLNAGSPNGAWNVSFDSDNVLRGNYGYRDLGQSVRHQTFQS